MFSEGYAVSGVQVDSVLDSAVETLLWSECGSNGEPLDGLYSIDDVCGECLLSFRDDIEGFLSMAEEKDLLVGLKAGQVGHDLVLTANGHGAGFWDRGLGERGDELTRLAESFSFEAYVGNEGKVCISS